MSYLILLLSLARCSICIRYLLACAADFISERRWRHSLISLIFLRRLEIWNGRLPLFVAEFVINRGWCYVNAARRVVCIACAHRLLLG